MTPAMHIVTLKDTGHILAAIAQTTTSGDPTLEALVGRDLPIWQSRITASVDLPTQSLLPVEVMEVKSVALDPTVVANPHQHDGGRVVRLPPSSIVAADVVLVPAQITFRSGAPDTFGLALVAEVSGPSDNRRVQSGKFANPVADLVLPLSIVPGDGPASIPGGTDYIVLGCAGRKEAQLVHGQLAMTDMRIRHCDLRIRRSDASAAWADTDGHKRLGVRVQKLVLRILEDMIAARLDGIEAQHLAEISLCLTLNTADIVGAAPLARPALRARRSSAIDAGIARGISVDPVTVRAEERSGRNPSEETGTGLPGKAKADETARFLLDLADSGQLARALSLTRTATLARLLGPLLEILNPKKIGSTRTTMIAAVPGGGAPLADPATLHPALIAAVLQFLKPPSEASRRNTTTNAADAAPIRSVQELDSAEVPFWQGQVISFREG